MTIEIDHRGKVALVTGGGAGIGREIARWLAAAGEGGEIHLLDADSDQEIHTLQTDQAPVFTLSFSPNGKWLAAGDDSGRVRSYPFSGEWP